jgi:predicted acyl esterase
VAATCLLLAAVVPAPAARADLESLKAACVTRDALDDDTSGRDVLPYVFCDDGVPAAGGRTPNEGAQLAVAVPQRYDGVDGLPDKALPPDPDAGADSNGDIALDVDLSLPDPRRFPPSRRGYPLVVMMHGCCGGDKTGWERDTIEPDDAEGWHYSNAWFASRGYVVLTYTARGFVSSDADGNRGSTGETQIDDLRYEINDAQHLIGQLVDDPSFHVDRRRVVATGGSYGGGFSWLMLTDPEWKSPGGSRVRLAAVAAKYGWSSLVYSLVPNGADGLRDELPSTDPDDAASPLGVPKQSITLGLYASGKFGIPPGAGSHATFPPKIDEGIACLNSSDPYESNPACAGTLSELLPEFVRFRSAYYRNDFFEDLRKRRIRPVPVFSAGTFTDPLFTEQEHRRMVERLRESVGHYPVQEFYGDYNHFVQNKEKEWADLCGEDRDRCGFEDYPDGDLDRRPKKLVRGDGEGATTRLNRFLDHFARPDANRDEDRPPFDVTASLQICPENASDEYPEDGPGPRFTERSFERLAPNELRIELSGTQATTNNAEPNPHALSSDPVANEQANDKRCPVEDDPAGPGVATYDSPELPRTVTMIGQTRLKVKHTGTGSGGIQLNARLYDLFPDDTAVMVDRGVRVLDGPDGTTVLDLQGNGWRFEEGHRVRVELAQDNGPYLKPFNQPSALVLSAVTVRMPIRERSRTLGEPEPGSRERTGSEVEADGETPGLPLPDDVPPVGGVVPGDDDDGDEDSGEEGGDGGDGGDGEAPPSGPAVGLPGPIPGL